MTFTILLADDNEANREVARVTLEAVGYRVVEAANGWEALELARKEKPAILILVSLGE
jgi:CheY-like chemotaxis protein